MIIDFHTHPFIRKECNSCFYEGIVDNSEAFRNDLQSAGIDHICGSIIEKVSDFEDIHRLNQEAIALQEKWSDFYTAGIHIHPKFVDKSIEELQLCGKKGIKLVGELVPYYNGWEDYYDNSMAEIYSAIDELKMVVSVHTQREETLEMAVKSFPNITFVAAHPRDREDFYGHIDRMKKYPNYYVDLSGTGLFRYGMLKTMVDKVGSEKILFGTDYPICNPLMYVKAVEFEKITDRERENIFENNARRILNI